MDNKQIFNDNFRAIRLVMDVFKANEVTTSEAKIALQFVIDNIDKCSVVNDNRIEFKV